MRPEKQAITAQYIARLNNSPFFFVVDYQGLKVGPMTELRKRLFQAGAEVHVVKNSIFRIAAKEAGVAELNGNMGGQTAVVTGQRDVAVTAKILKTFASEFERPKIKFGYLNNQRLEAAQVAAIADLPPIGQLRAKLVGLMQSPATSLVQLLQTPASQLVRVLKLKSEQSA